MQVFETDYPTRSHYLESKSAQSGEYKEKFPNMSPIQRTRGENPKSQPNHQRIEGEKLKDANEDGN